RGTGRPPRPRVVPAVLGRQGRHRRHPQTARRGVPPRLARRDGDVGRDRGAGRQAVEGGRIPGGTPPGTPPGAPPMTTLAQPSRVRSFLRLVAIEHSVFALPFAYLSALAAMTVNNDDVRAAGLAGSLIAAHGGGRVRWPDLVIVTI